MFENKMYKGIRYSRFLGSWIHEGGSNDFRFVEWLRSLEFNGEKIPEEIVEEIYQFNYYFCGKSELESNARQFLKDKNYILVGNRPYINVFRI